MGETLAVPDTRHGVAAGLVRAKRGGPVSPVAIPSYGIAALRRLSRHGFAAVLVSAAVLLTLAPLGVSAASFSATASVTPTNGYLNDAMGTTYTLTVKNTGTVYGIGA